MAEVNIESSAIEVFPCSNRSDTIDRYASLAIEHNLINIVNRLTGVNSFIISGMNITGTTMTPGSCNIRGFLFNFPDQVENLPAPGSNDKYLCLKINVAKDSSTGKEQLASVSDSSTALDNDKNFTGLCFATYTQTAYEAVKAPTYVLPIAEKSGNTWVEIKFEDGDANKTDRAFKQLFKLNQILVQSDQAGNAYANKEQTLKTFLEQNYIIDDGEVK